MKSKILTSELNNDFISLIEKIKTGNDIWSFISSIAVLIIGFLLLEILWRYLKRKMDSVFGEKGVETWESYLSGFLPPIRIAFTAILLRIAELPLVIPKNILTLLHGVEAFLVASALILFFSQLVRAFDLVYSILPSEALSKVSERILRNLKGILRISGVILAAGIFVYSQKSLFPDWLWETQWWRYVSLIIMFAILYVGERLINTFLQTMVDALKDLVEKARLRLVLVATRWPIRLLLLAIAVYAVQEILNLPKEADKFAETLVSILSALAIVVFLYRLLNVIEYELTKFVSRDDNEFDMNFVQMVRVVVKVLIIVFGSIYLLKAATGKPMTTLLAGLGIGGLAIALAAQDTLKNLFGSVMVMLDKPFRVGDRVVADGFDGVVEEIGFRSTRLRALSGHLISMPNEKMAGISVENIGLRPSIRRLANITITYDTPPDKVEKALSIIKEILNDHEGMHPDYPPRVYFNEFNDTALNILMIYWYHPPDYWKFTEFGEKVNFQIMRAFEAEGIEFAFPTSTTYLAQDSRRPLHINITDKSRMGDSEDKGQ